MINLSTGVFSCFGSHLSVFAMHRGEQNANRGKRVEKNTGAILYDAGLTPGLYIRNFIHRRDYEMNLFKLDIPGFETECPAYTCLPEKLDVHGAGVEMVFATADTLLIRTKVDLSISSHCLKGAKKVRPDSFQIHDEVNRYSLRFTAMSGSLSVQAENTCVAMQVSAGSIIRVDECWEHMGEMQPVPGFDEGAALQRKSYEDFLSRLPKPLKGDEKLMELAAYGLWHAVAHPRGNYKRESMLVSKNYMCGLWSWDHCFAAMACSFVSPELSWDQFMCVFDDQREDGRLPDCVEAVKTEWGYLKPPVHGLTLGMLRSRMELSQAQRREAYEKLGKWVLYWITYRDPQEEGLPRFLHGNDSGHDNNTIFDKKGDIQSAELPAYLIQVIDELIPLAEEFDPESIPAWKARAERLRQAMLRELFVDNLPIARLADTKERVGVYSSVPYLAITLGMGLPEEVRKAMLRKLDDPNFLTPYGIASEALNSPEYQLDGYSRGSIWSYFQFLPVLGLRKMGEYEYAKKIMKGYISCIRRGGFSECFCSKDGSGQRDRFLNWTVCVYVIFTAWLRELGEE